MIGKQKIQRRRKSRKTYFVGATIAALYLGIIASLVTYPDVREIRGRTVNSQLEKVFSEYDANKDGVLDKQEFMEYLEEN